MRLDVETTLALVERFLSNKTPRRHRVDAVLVFSDWLEETIGVRSCKDPPRSLCEKTSENRAAWLFKQLRGVFWGRVIGEPIFAVTLLNDISGVWSYTGIPNVRFMLGTEPEAIPDEDEAPFVHALSVERRGPLPWPRSGRHHVLLPTTNSGEIIGTQFVTRAHLEYAWDPSRLPAWLPADIYRRKGRGDNRYYVPVLLPSRAVELLVRRLCGAPVLS